MKEEIRKYGYSIGADAVGFASIEDYRSQRSLDPKTIMPDVRSIVVLAYRQLDGALDSNNVRTAMSARIGLIEESNRGIYLLSKFMEDRFKVKATPVLFSYPLNMDAGVMGLIGDVSLRHAAVAAGLGAFGRHNLVIHPRLGSRVAFTAALTELPLRSDPPVQDELCNQCGLCVESCPAKALDEAGKTDEMKCLKISQAYGIGGALAYIRKFIGQDADAQKVLLKDPLFLSLYQASFIGFQYLCFNCIKVCPAGGK
jgi:epoxyqueuosine reductase